MTDRRALLTDREREIVAGDADVEDSYRYQTISRVRARFARLEEDLEALEKHGDLADELREIVSPGEEPLGTVDDGEDTPRDADLAEQVRRYLEEVDAPPKTEHGRNAVIDVFRYLREHGTAQTAEIQDGVYSDYTGEWETARTMWNGIDRYLEDVPGVEKAGYGKWAYAGDDTVRDEVRTDA